jgi:beta-ureidopropionase / N-carbamoyl-L-amino-acid hydrolase
VVVTGMECHAGSTPMRLRHDALLAAARMIEAVQQAASAQAPDAVGTVGLIEAHPNSRNVIPGEVFFTVDIRHPQDATLDVIEDEIGQKFARIAGEAGVTVAIERVWDSPSVHFDRDCVASVERAAGAQKYPARKIVSGAGHDAAYVARVAPTAMIFVPCENGISHNELERAEPEHVAAGANVLLHAVLETDAHLAGQGRA